MTIPPMKEATVISLIASILHRYSTMAIIVHNTETTINVVKKTFFIITIIFYVKLFLLNAPQPYNRQTNREYYKAIVIQFKKENLT